VIKNKSLLEKIEGALQQMRPFLEADGGNIELVGVTDDYVAQVKLLGACSNCSMSIMTLKAGIEEAVKRAVPEIKSVENLASSEVEI
jgi:Fe-S cluster biogenesis protein NfuA